MFIIKKQINNFKVKNRNEKMIIIFNFVLLFLIFLFLIQLLYYSISSFPYGLLRPPLFHKDFNDSFMDFFNINYYIKGNDPYGNLFKSNYPPFALLIAKCFSWMGDYSQGAKSARLSAGGIVSFIIFLLIIFCSLILLAIKALKGKDLKKSNILLVIVIICLSGPILFAIQRGNYILLALVFVCFFMIYKNDKRKVMRELAIIALAMAVAMKIYPAVFGIFLFKEKKYKEILRFAIYAAILFFIPFVFFEGGFNNLKLLINNLQEFNNYYIVGFLTDDGLIIINHGLSNNYSIVNIFQMIQIVFNGGNILDVELSHKIARIFTPILFCIMFIMLFFLRKDWQKSSVCALMMTLIPSPSYTYILIFFIIPIIQFLFDKQEKQKLDYIILIAFIIIINPFYIGYIIPDKGNFRGLSVNTVIINIVNVLFLMILMYYALTNLIKILKTKKLKLQANNAV